VIFDPKPVRGPKANRTPESALVIHRIDNTMTGASGLVALAS